MPRGSANITKLLTFSIAGSFLLMFWINDKTPSSASELTATPTPISTEIAAGTIVKDRNGFEMAYVPSGVLEMGISRENFLDTCQDILNGGDRTECQFLADDLDKDTSILHVHNVSVASFWIDQYEVTIEAYGECSKSRVCNLIDLSDLPNEGNNPRKPQVRVLWYDALLFCNLRGARLPTEAEWEYAAKGSEQVVFPWGNSFEISSLSSINSTYVVGTAPENISWSKVYDLSGNVAEWVEDRFLPYSPSQEWRTGSGIEVSRVIRGGSWFSGVFQLTTFYRDFERAGVPVAGIGFRCARSSYPLDM
jgi:formylglycine-generating enzyme required for sulfatase activity